MFQYEPMHESITFHVTSYNNSLLASFVILYSPRNAAYKIFGYMESETLGRKIKLIEKSIRIM